MCACVCACWSALVCCKHVCARVCLLGHARTRVCVHVRVCVVHYVAISVRAYVILGN